MPAALDWFTDAVMWSGPAGIPRRLLEHLWFSVAGVALAALVALPTGMLTGHTGRGGLAATAVSNYWRALPTLGVVVLVFQVAPLSVWPVLAALVLIAIPPILLNTDAALRGVDAAAREAAAGMGMTGWQQLRRVELPLATPLVLAGLRSASAQVIATTTIAAFVGLGGLGRFIIDGYASRDLPQVTGGAVLIAALALVVDGCFALVERRLDAASRTTRRGGPRPPPYLAGRVRHHVKEVPS